MRVQIVNGPEVKTIAGYQAPSATNSCRGSTHLQKALERIVQLYEATGQADEAAEWTLRSTAAGAAAIAEICIGFEGFTSLADGRRPSAWMHDACLNPLNRAETPDQFEGACGWSPVERN